MDEEEIRRLEELIPGTDQEDEPPQPQTPSLLYRLLHRPRREEPMPEDIAPQQLARTYGKGLKACACAPWPSSCWLRWLYSSYWCLPSTLYGCPRWTTIRSRSGSPAAC